MKRQTKMKKIFLSVIILLSALTVYGQRDPEAMKILSDFSKKATSASSVSITFNIVNNDTKDGSITTLQGSVVIKGDNYRLILPDNSVWSDGKTIWSYLPDVNEVTIANQDKEDKSFMSKPSLLFSLYQEGYKVRLLEQTKDTWTIDLYPEDINQNFLRIRMKIGKSLYDLKSAEYKTKDGVIITLNAEKYDLTFKPGSDFFIFNPTSYKGVEIIDMK
jgi:outer membrane lipoprotein carrier protein